MLKVGEPAISRREPLPPLEDGADAPRLPAHVFRLLLPRVLHFRVPAAVYFSVVIP